MKALLLKAVLLAGVSLGVAGCNTNFQPVGTPTATIAVPNSGLVNNPTTTVTNGQTVTVPNFVLTAIIEIRTLPGSPGGTIGNFILSNAGTLASSVNADPCPAATTTNGKLCGPFTITYSQSFGQTPPATGSVKIVSYSVIGTNGLSATIQANPPITVY